MARNGDIELAIVYLEEIEEYTRCTMVGGQPLPPAIREAFREIQENVDSATNLLR